MQQVTVGTKYQIVIPKEVRKKVLGLKPGTKVGIYATDKSSIRIDAQPKSWIDRTRGMMKEAWKDINTTKYLEDLRNEWEHKP